MKNILGKAGTLGIIFIFAACSGQKLSNVNENEIKVLSELRENIKKHINDDENRKALLKITDEIEQETQKFFSFYQKHNQKLAEVNRNYKATQDDFDLITNTFNTNYENYLKTLIRKRSEMRELTSTEDWKKIMEREYSFIPG